MREHEFSSYSDSCKIYWNIFSEMGIEKSFSSPPLLDNISIYVNCMKILLIISFNRFHIFFLITSDIIVYIWL